MKVSQLKFSSGTDGENMEDFKITYNDSRTGKCRGV